MILVALLLLIFLYWFYKRELDYIEQQKNELEHIYNLIRECEELKADLLKRSIEKGGVQE